MIDAIVDRITGRMGLAAEEQSGGWMTPWYGPRDRSVPHVTICRYDEMVILRFYEGDYLYDNDLSIHWQADGRIRCCTQKMPKHNRPLDGVRSVARQVDAITDGALLRGLRAESDNWINPHVVAWLDSAPVDPLPE